jgi:O-acetyl-ADP-ribose deacetylase (regulator of RNase III)
VPWRGVTPRRIDVLPGGALLLASQGSVVPFSGDAIVNAANTGCLGGGGVDGAINDAGGVALEDARYALPIVASPRVRCPTGDAKITTGGDLRARWCIHAVGPDFRAYDDDDEADALLASAYRSAMLLAQEKGLHSVAFSLISAAIFRGHRPLSAVLGIAVRTIRAHAYEGLQEVHLVAFTPAEIRGLLNTAELAATEAVPPPLPAQPAAAAPAGAAEADAAAADAPDAAPLDAVLPDAAAATAPEEARSCSPPAQDEHAAKKPCNSH